MVNELPVDVALHQAVSDPSAAYRRSNAASSIMVAYILATDRKTEHIIGRRAIGRKISEILRLPR